MPLHDLLFAWGAWAVFVLPFLFLWWLLLAELWVAAEFAVLAVHRHPGCPHAGHRGSRVRGRHLVAAAVRAVDGGPAMSDDLTAFLTARLDEDERYLNSNRHHLWTQRPLREVTAKRIIVNELAPEADSTDADRDGWTGVHDRDLTADPLLGEVLLLTVAAVYSDHPDYRQVGVVRIRRERTPCGCKAGRPRLDCVPCQAARLVGEAIERARREVAREMTPLPGWYVRDLQGGRY